MFEFKGKWENIPYRFTAFEGMQSRQGAYTSMSSRELSDGTVSLHLEDELNEDFNPRKEQIATINWIAENGDAIKESIFVAVQGYYIKMKEIYGYDANDVDHQAWFPTLASKDDLGKAMGVGNLRISIVHKDGLCIYNLECGCTWDDEHGLGIKMYKDQVLLIEDASSALGEGVGTTAIEMTGTYAEYVEEKRAVFKVRNEKWSKNPLHPDLYTKPIFYFPHPVFGTRKPSQIRANEEYDKQLIYGGFAKEYKVALEHKIIKASKAHVKLAIVYLRINILEIIKEECPDCFNELNKRDRNGLNPLDQVYNKLNNAHNYEEQYLEQVGQVIEWLESNGAKRVDK